MSNTRKDRYVSVERPDQRAKIDFLSFCPKEGLSVSGASVTVELNWDNNKEVATLHVYAVDEADSKILIDQSYELHVAKTENDEEAL